MAEASIPVDLHNPGQVFACIGFLEAAEKPLGNARGGFDWNNEADIRFRLSADGEGDPAKKVLAFLAGSSVRSLAPDGSDLRTEKWNVPTLPLTDDSPFPFPVPDSLATLPVELRCSEASVVVEHWGEDRKTTGRDNVKFWAGMQGKPGAKVALEALETVHNSWRSAISDPFNLGLPQSSSFRFDWRRDYIPLDIGFSINNHKNRIETIGYPLVEVLAAIGLTHARPEYISKLEYRYGVLGVTADDELFDPLFLRASLGASELPFSQRIFRMQLGWPGKEGQARCITTTYEENSNE